MAKAAAPAVGAGSAHHSAGRLAALDGVRGVAVAVVVAYHLGVRQVHGGLFGVDVFFVLSGYLITGLLLDEWRRKGDISLAAFWGRRARRLLPALLLLIAVIAVTARWVLPSDQLGSVRGDAYATLFYSANWHAVFAGHGYFAAFAAPSPLLHTWSLAVEEQFYVIWPFIAVLTLRKLRSWKWLLGISAVGAVASAGLMGLLAVKGVGADRLYYGTDTRAQGLLAGAALSGIVFGSGRNFTGARVRSAPARHRRRADGGWWQGLLSVAGAAGAAILVACFVRVDGQSKWLYRGGFGMIALATVALIAAVVLQPRSWLARICGFRPLRVLGILSYGIYLWHWPMIVLLTHDRTGLAGAELMAARIGATLAVAVTSFLFFEQPIRERRWVLPRPVVAVPAVFAGLAVVVAASPFPRPASLNAAMLRLATATPTTTTTAAPVVVAGAVTATTASTVPPATLPPVAHTGPLRVMIVGDSVAASLGTGILPWQSKAGIVFSNQGYIGCGIARGGATSFKAYTQPPACLTWPQRWQGLVDSFHPDVTLVLLGRWEVLDRVHDGQWMHIGQPTFDAYLTSELELATQTLTSRGGRVAFLTAPCNNHELADLASPGRLPPDDAHRVDLFNALQAKVATDHPGVTRMVDFAGLLCPGGQFQRSLSGVPLRTSDGVHLQPLAGRLFVEDQLPELLSWLRNPTEVLPGSPTVPSATTTTTAVSPA